MACHHDHHFRDELEAVLDGDYGRDLSELRAHLAAVEGLMPGPQRQAIADEFGALLHPDPPHLRPGPPEPKSPLVEPPGQHAT